MDAFLTACVVLHLLLIMLQQPSSSLASDHRSHLHRPRPATQPAARAATFIVPGLLRPSADAANTRVSGLTRCSGNPADTGLFAVHATDFVAPDLLLTQPLSSLVTSTSLLCRWSSVPASRFQLELPDHQLQPPTSINQSIKELPDHQLQPPTSINQSNQSRNYLTIKFKYLQFSILHRWPSVPASNLQVQFPSQASIQLQCYFFLQPHVQTTWTIFQTE